LTHTPK